MKKYLIIIAAILLGTATLVYAAPQYIYQKTILPEGSIYDIGTSTQAWRGIFGQYFTATSTNTASIFPYASTTQVSSSNSAWFATSGGKVGIASTTPFSVLSTDVTGTGKVLGLRRTDVSSTLTVDFSGGVANFDSSSDYVHKILDIERTRLTTTGYGIGSSTPYAKLSVTNTGTGPTAVFEDTTSPDSTPFIIDANGNTGVGTSTPFARLSVKGTGTGTGTVFATSDSSNVSGLTVLDNGIVGIGDTTPTTQLTVESSGYSTNVTGIRLANTSVPASWIMATGVLNQDETSFGLRNVNLGANAITALYANNYVGIGTTSPQTTLSVSSSNSTTDTTTFTSTPAAGIVNTNTTANNFSSLYFRQANSLGTSVTSSYIAGRHIDHTSGSEDGGLVFGGTTNGTTNQWASWIDGSLGINVATPNNYSKFQVATTSSTGSQSLVQLINTSSAAGSTAALDFTMSGSQATQANPFGARIETTREGSGAASSMRFGTTDGSNYNTVMTIASTTNVGIGTTTPGAKLGVSLSGAGSIFSLDRTDAAGGLSFDFTGAVANIRSETEYVWSILGIERSRMNTVGLGLSTSSPSAKLSVKGSGTSTGRLLAFSDSNNLERLRMHDDGTLFIGYLTTAAGTPNSVCMNATTKEVTENAALTCTVSDEEQKNSIKPLEVSALDTIRQIQPISFYYNDNPNRLRYGFGAQSLQKVDQQLADGYDKDGIARSIDIPALISLNTAAIKELDAKAMGLYRSAEENWQWLIIILLAVGMGYQQYQIRKIKNETH